jgi:hypothetical protein
MTNSLLPPTAHRPMLWKSKRNLNVISPTNMTPPKSAGEVVSAACFRHIAYVEARALGPNRPTAYFNELLIEVNFVFSLLPMPFTTAMMASAMPAAISPYSIAVAPVSSARNLRNVFIGRAWTPNTNGG